DEIL
ncbi:effector from type III secretion system family protein, partial [Chlamydia psittaci 02DC14]